MMFELGNRTRGSYFEGVVASLLTNRRCALGFLLLVGTGLCLDCSSVQAQEPRANGGAERLWEAARTGNREGVKKELDAGVDVNAATAYQSTALCFSSDRGHEDVVRLLLERGANPNVKGSYVAALDLKTGEEVYKKRLKRGETLSFTASPIAADGHLYFTSESGHVYVVQAGGVFKQLHVNALGSKVLSTPAISEGVFYVRTVDQVIALRGSNP